MNIAKEVQAPNSFIMTPEYKTIFLGGSIDMGSAEEWQRRMVNELKDKKYIFLNPRRNDWDVTLKQTLDEPKFVEQVTWELKCLNIADFIVIYFDPKSKAPISLLELGLQAKNNNLLVCCPEGFYRKGNVDIVCMVYGIKQVSTLDELINTFK